jgi:hypothetical protein
MLSRALRLATVTLLIGCFAAIPVQAQNLEAGKSPSQIFAGTCSACHKSPRGLLKTVPAGSLPGFLRQHYTTSSDMASLLSAFLTSNGAADTRYVGTQPKQDKQDKDAKPEAKPAGPAEQLDRHGRRLRPPVPPQDIPKPETQPQQAERPDDGDELPPQAEPRRQGRNAKRLARPSEAPDAAKPAVEGRAPAHAVSERSPEGRKSAAKQRLSKRGKPGGEELPKTDAGKADAARDEPPKRDPVQEDRPQNDTKYEGRPEGANTPGEGKSEAAKSEAAKIEAPKQTGNGDAPALRSDPVPSVTPAPQASPAAPTAASSGTAEPTTGASGPSPQPAPPAVTALVPPPPPVAPAGPPVPPISQ